MIDYIKDMFVVGSKITNFPYTLKGPIAIVSKNGKYIRCPAWGWEKTIVKVDKQYVYVQSDTIGRIDVFDAHGDKVKEISQLPIYICDDYPQTVEDIKNKIEEINRYSTIGFIVIDYLQLIDRENISCDEILQELKNIAEDLNIPIFILTQLTTALENRRYKMPLLKDIRVFKKYTHIDKILFLYRECYYLYWNEPKRTSKQPKQLKDNSVPMRLKGSKVNRRN